MKNNNNKQLWYCDRCHEEIKNSKDGVVVWFTDSNHEAVKGSLKILHHYGDNPEGCFLSNEEQMSDYTLSFLSLEDFIDPSNGLTNLIECIQLGSISISDGLHLIKRLYIDGFEEAYNLHKDIEMTWGNLLTKGGIK